MPPGEIVPESEISSAVRCGALNWSWNSRSHFADLSNGRYGQHQKREKRQKMVAEGSHDVTWGTKNKKRLRRSPDAARSDYFVANWSRASCADKRSP